jgi:hypothetical protein
LKVDWSVRCEILENEKITFSSCDVTLSKPSLSYGTSGQVETPKKRKAAGGSPHAPWKASSLERKSTTFKSNNVGEKNAAAERNE